jgi:hypothetical protein
MNSKPLIIDTADISNEKLKCIFYIQLAKDTVISNIYYAALKNDITALKYALEQFLKRDCDEIQQIVVNTILQSKNVPIVEKNGNNYILCGLVIVICSDNVEFEISPIPNNKQNKYCTKGFMKITISDKNYDLYDELVMTAEVSRYKGIYHALEELLSTVESTNSFCSFMCKYMSKQKIDRIWHNKILFSTSGNEVIGIQSGNDDDSQYRIYLSSPSASCFPTLS